MAMGKKKSHQHDTDDEIDDDLRNSAKIMNGDINTVASSICTSSCSYDTTEDLTDTDNSSQVKSDNLRRKTNEGSGKNIAENSSDNDGDGDRRIRFNMKATKVRHVESHNLFSTKERGNYWWSDREKDRMMAKHERLVAKYEQQRTSTKPGTSKKPSADRIASYRGLESWTAAGSLKLDYTIEQCITAVMDEQDRQWNENDDDADVISEKSLAVTEDSARRARLNGLQDAQEALRLRGVSWLKNGSDEMSVSSAISTGTVAIAKKKKRSKLLARLDDSHQKASKSSLGSDKEDVLGSLKKSKEGKKSKKKKKKSSKKNLTSSSRKSKKKKSKDKNTGMDSKPSSYASDADHTDTNDQELRNSRTTSITQDTTIGQEKLSSDTTADDVGSRSSAVSSFLAGPTTPVSPLSTHVTTNSTTSPDEYPLLATLRRQQEQLRQNSRVNHDDIKSTLYHQQESVVEEDDDQNEDISPLLQTLRRQQKMQALKWQNQQGEDPSDDAMSDSDTKVSSLRDEYSRTGDSATANSSDPPGRRPRRLGSRHNGAHGATPEKSRNPNKNSRRRPERSSSSSYTPPPAIPLSSGTLDSTSGDDSSTGKKSLKMIRSTLFSKGSKK